MTYEPTSEEKTRLSKRGNGIVIRSGKREEKSGCACFIRQEGQYRCETGAQVPKNRFKEGEKTRRKGKRGEGIGSPLIGVSTDDQRQTEKGGRIANTEKEDARFWKKGGKKCGRSPCAASGLNGGKEGGIGAVRWPLVRKEGKQR